MIHHIVMLDLPSGYDAHALADVMLGLADLGLDIDGFVGFSHGPNKDFEGMSPDCAYGFICTFTDQATSMSYLANTKHQALGARLVALCRGGADGITVVDMATAE